MQTPSLLIYRHYARMMPLEVSIVILNHIADWAQQTPFEKQAEWAVEVLAFLKGY
jgi:hypothetical protein